MASTQRISVYVTFVEKDGPFLKLWGQTEKNKAELVKQVLSDVAPQFDLVAEPLSTDLLVPGRLVCVKYRDKKYYRAKILKVFVREGLLEVSFIDFGNKETVACDEIRSFHNLTPLVNIPPLAVGFIIAEAHCMGGEWNDLIFESIVKEIKYRDVQCTLLAQSTHHYLVRISIENTDICNLFIQRGYMQPTSLQAQQAVLLSMSMQKQPTPQPQETNSVSSGINTYKACTLEPGYQYPVYVSYVNDGPCHFSVQLKNTENVLVNLMTEINDINLRILEDIPIPGTICLARCQEDNNICRAVVTAEEDTQFKVFYVDFGNYEVLPAESLYQIPFKYVLPKVMAIRFSLAGVEKSTVTLDMQLAFKKFVDTRLLHMMVLPSPTRTALPKCELWDPETNTRALDVVMNAAKHAYPEPVTLTRGFSQQVKVSYVYSCNRLYVQFTSKENDLMSLMENLQELCQSNNFMEASMIKPQVPCCALFKTDGLWYRSQVVEVMGNDVKVRYIDYGNEELIPTSQLKDINGEILTVTRPQAIECCLNGYQKMEPDEVRDGLLEELILEGVFTMKVVDMCDKKALVDLFDESDYNVASLLLDKLAAAKSQMGPVLAVQAGNKLEHRKSYTQQREQNFKDKPHNTEREQKSWDKPNDRNEKSWRQDTRDNRNYDKNTNENDTNSWRQNNKGFSPNSRLDKYKNQDDTWDNSENKSNNNSNWSTSAPVVSENTWNDSNNTETQGNSGWGDSNNDSRRNNDYKSNRGGFNDKEGRGGFNNNRDRGDRGERDRGGFNSERPRGDRGGSYNDRERGGSYNDRERGGFRSDRGGRGGDKFGGRSRDGYKPRDFKKDSSEMSSSGSEKSFQRGPRTSSRADGGRGGKNFDKPRSSFKDYSNSGGGGESWENVTSAENSWNVSTVASNIDAAPVDATFVNYEVLGTESKVAISWFHNPGLFYCQLLNDQEQFKTIMEEIHDYYKDRKPEKAVQGSPVIGLFPEDSVLYRAKVLDVIGNEYKVQYVDYGNVSTISKVWPIDKKFMILPAQAIACCLNNVAPVGEQWSDPDGYSRYFDKENFTCNFVNKDEEKTFVNLIHESEDVSQLLVRDGLAMSTALTVPDIEIPILIGQQFKAIVKSVNNLSDIILALECGLAVSCTMHNLETATETFEDTLKGLLEQAVIVYVDNVLEDYRLEITLYDPSGNKQAILEPDEGSFDTVDIPCPLLILRSVISGYVTFANETSIYIQPSEVADQVTTLLDQLFETYDGKPHENTIIPEEEMFYAVHSDDGNWYRGKVISFDDEKATVCYVDYGNSESVAFAELRELEAQFLDISILSIQITVPSDANTFVDKDVIATIYFGEAGWEGTVEIVDVTNTETLPEIPSAENEISEFASTEIEIPEEIPAGENNLEVEIEAVAEDEVANTEQTEPTIGTSVAMSHIDSPSDFYLQFNENLEAIDNLQAELQEKVEEMEVLVNPAPGVLCAAPYSLDQMWYRAEVLDADEDITTVRFVDFGNTDVIDNNTTQIKTLSQKLLSLAIYATRCSLKIEPIEEDWSPLAQGVFESLTNEGSLTADFCNQDEKCTYVELYSSGVNIKDALVSENLAKLITTTTESKQTGFVSHFNSPSEFWIQLESCVDELEWIAEQLSSAANFPDLTDLTPGTLCAALFSDDQMWYRARILSNTTAGVELLFIDYGNSCTSADLKQLPEDLIMTAPLAMKCSLQKNEGIPTWSPEASAKFTEISADGQTIFTVKKISTGETSVVQLYLDDKDVTTMLLPSTEDGYVKEIETLENLSIEKGNGETVEEVALEPLEGQKLEEEAKEKLEELNEQGSTLFQIEFVNEKTVRLYLQGKDIRPLLGGFINPAFNPLLNEEQQNSISVENVGKELNVSDCEPTESCIDIEDTNGSEEKEDLAEQIISKELDLNKEESIGIKETEDSLQQNSNIVKNVSDSVPAESFTDIESTSSNVEDIDGSEQINQDIARQINSEESDMNKEETKVTDVSEEREQDVAKQIDYEESVLKDESIDIKEAEDNLEQNTTIVENADKDVDVSSSVPVETFTDIESTSSNVEDIAGSEQINQDIGKQIESEESDTNKEETKNTDGSKEKDVAKQIDSEESVLKDESIDIKEAEDNLEQNTTIVENADKDVDVSYSVPAESCADIQSTSSNVKDIDSSEEKEQTNQDIAKHIDTEESDLKEAKPVDIQKQTEVTDGSEEKEQDVAKQIDSEESNFKKDESIDIKEAEDNLEQNTTIVENADKDVNDSYSVPAESCADTSFNVKDIDGLEEKEQTNQDIAKQIDSEESDLKEEEAEVTVGSEEKEQTNQDVAKQIDLEESDMNKEETEVTDSSEEKDVAKQFDSDKSDLKKEDADDIEEQTADDFKEKKDTTVISTPEDSGESGTHVTKDTNVSEEIESNNEDDVKIIDDISSKIDETEVESKLDQLEETVNLIAASIEESEFAKNINKEEVAIGEGITTNDEEENVLNYDAPKISLESDNLSEFELGPSDEEKETVITYESLIDDFKTYSERIKTETDNLIGNVQMSVNCEIYSDNRDEEIKENVLKDEVIDSESVEIGELCGKDEKSIETSDEKTEITDNDDSNKKIESPTTTEKKTTKKSITKVTGDKNKSNKIAAKSSSISQSKSKVDNKSPTVKSTNLLLRKNSLKNKEELSPKEISPVKTSTSTDLKKKSPTKLTTTPTKVTTSKLNQKANQESQLKTNIIPIRKSDIKINSPKTSPSKLTPKKISPSKTETSVKLPSDQGGSPDSTKPLNVVGDVLRDIVDTATE